MSFMQFLMCICCICYNTTLPHTSYEKKQKPELDRLVQEGTLEKVDHSDWEAPIVAVLKSDKQSMRICGDFKQQ